MLSTRLGLSFTRPCSRLWSSTVAPPLPESQQKVIVADNGRTIVCWHPEEPFPYEFTKALPVNPPVEDTSLLKDIKLNYKELSPEETRNRLMKLTASTKHRWFPICRTKKDRIVPPDREYL